MRVPRSPLGVRPSLPSRGAWIEMFGKPSGSVPPLVAPLTGSVDRNDFGIPKGQDGADVAPLAGSVDRNGELLGKIGGARLVALLAGSVDRNQFCSTLAFQTIKSLPSRGAWIEIPPLALPV